MEQDNRISVTILVQSCDKYSDIWPIFFQVFKQQWPDCPYQIVLNTEQKTYQYPGLNIKCLQLYKDYTGEALQHISWSERYIETLKHIHTKNGNLRRFLCAWCGKNGKKPATDILRNDAKKQGYSTFGKKSFCI